MTKINKINICLKIFIIRANMIKNLLKEKILLNIEIDLGFEIQTINETLYNIKVKIKLDNISYLIKFEYKIKIKSLDLKI